MRRRRWRPPAALVLLGALFGTLALSLAGLVALRLAGPEIGYRNAALLIAGVIAGATAVLGWLLARLILGPVRALSRYAAHRQAGDASAAPPGRFGTAEMGELGAAVRGMAEALARREATVRAFADHATHELKTPVTTIRAAAELLSDSDGLREGDRALAVTLLSAAAQLETQLAALRAVALAREPVHAGRAALAEVLPRLDPGPLRVEVRGDAGRPLPLAAEGLRIVLQEIARNAGAHGATRLMLTVGHRPGGSALVAEDDGPGVSPGHAGRVFEPFFTSRREEGGSGMGLAIAAALLNAHGASIRLVPSERGARFEIAFGASLRD